MLDFNADPESLLASCYNKLYVSLHQLTLAASNNI